MGRFIPIIVSLLAGVALAAQGPINSELARYVGKIHAVLVSITVSTITILILLVLIRGDGSFTQLGGAPRWALVGGVCGVMSLVGTIIAVPRIGVAATTAAILGAQLCVSAIIDQFGLLGVAVRPITPGRLAGLALLVVAVALVTRG